MAEDLDLGDEARPARLVPSFLDDDIPARAGERTEEDQEET
jgi:hypothetical protein